MTAPKTIVIRRGRENDALCVSVLATQVFLETYAGGGIRPDLAREVLVTGGQKPRDSGGEKARRGLSG